MVEMYGIEARDYSSVISEILLRTASLSTGQAPFEASSAKGYGNGGGSYSTPLLLGSWLRQPSRGITAIGERTTLSYVEFVLTKYQSTLH